MNFLNKLPHSYPFIFIDKVIDIKENKKAIALKMITSSEAIFQSKRYDNSMIVPWTLILEAMAQTSGFMLEKNTKAVVAELKNIFLYGNAYPGDCIKIISEKILNFDRLHYFETQALVEEKIIIRGDIILAEM